MLEGEPADDVRTHLGQEAAIAADEPIALLDVADWQQHTHTQSATRHNVFF